MSEPRRIIVGLLPNADVTYVGEGEIDPVAIMLREAHATLDAERAEDAARARQAVADAARLADSRKARVAHRFRRAD
jgi:hypothetical protein